MVYVKNVIVVVITFIYFVQVVQAVLEEAAKQKDSTAVHGSLAPEDPSISKIVSSQVISESDVTGNQKPTGKGAPRLPASARGAAATGKILEPQTSVNNHLSVNAAPDTFIYDGKNSIMNPDFIVWVNKPENSDTIQAQQYQVMIDKKDPMPSFVIVDETGFTRKNPACKAWAKKGAAQAKLARQVEVTWQKGALESLTKEVDVLSGTKIIAKNKGRSEWAVMRWFKSICDIVRRTLGLDSQADIIAQAQAVALQAAPNAEPAITIVAHKMLTESTPPSAPFMPAPSVHPKIGANGNLI